MYRKELKRIERRWREVRKLEREYLKRRGKLEPTLDWLEEVRRKLSRRRVLSTPP